MVIFSHFSVINCKIIAQMRRFSSRRNNKKKKTGRKEHTLERKHLFLQDIVRAEKGRLKGEYRSPEQVAGVEGISGGVMRMMARGRGEREFVKEGRVEWRGENQYTVCKCIIQRERLLQACGFISFCSYWQGVSGGNKVFPSHAPLLLISGAQYTRRDEKNKRESRTST